MVKSFGWPISVGLNCAFAIDKPYSVPTAATGLCAILIAAVAVSAGGFPVVPPDSAFANNVVHAEPVPFEFTHAARMFPSVLTSACGASPPPLPAVNGGIAAFATPDVCNTCAFTNAFAIPSLAAGVPELDTCTASVANPANAYAAATVETSFIKTNGVPVANAEVPPGQLPSAAISPAAGFVPVPKPGLPPSAYR